MVIEAFTHFFPAIDTEHLGNLGILHARFDKHIGMVAIVEGTNHFAREFNMRSLVDPNRDDIGFIQNDIGGHQHRIAYQAVVNVIWAQTDFFLEGRQVGQFPKRRYHRQDGMQFCDLWNVTLNKQDGFFRADTGCQQVERHVIGVLSQVGSILHRC